MTREQMLRKLYKIANDLFKDYTLDKWNEMWGLCSDWNSTHDSREEIFMSEICDDEDRVNGFMIEDDVWRWEE